MPGRAGSSDCDTIRILITTDNHVGYNERDPVRGDDSWKTFDEIMCLARDREVDMVLMAGDLFHENKPSRKAMYQVMRSLRQNCFGDKPCELQMLSDGSEHFAGSFNHVNYEDQDLNVAIPVFSIHGNHDDPSGEGHLAALDILSVSGLINYYGRTPESDNIHIKPVLLQKGKTKLALYGMSNVRDERLFRTFRDGQVKFFQPSRDTGDWFNIMSVHQNHHAYTDTNYLPERFLPGFMDLIIWGHEHECKIDPQTNSIHGFKVMQPGSSVATSLVNGEAVPKQVAILSLTGTEYRTENIRLKTVRPFIMKEISLSDYPEIHALAYEKDHKNELTAFLDGVVDELIKEAQQGWYELQEEADEMDEEEQPPLPLIRLRVEATPPEGGQPFDFPNPQRFSATFADRVANASDVLQVHRKRAAATGKRRQPDEPDERILQQTEFDSVAVEKLVNEYLAAQSLQVLPSNAFSDAVSQFVNKDDRHAMEQFLADKLDDQQRGLVGPADEAEEENDEAFDEDQIQEAMEKNRQTLEEQYSSGVRSRRRRTDINPKPDGWDSDVAGQWEDSIGAIRHVVGDANGDEDDASSVASGSRPARARGSRGGRGGKSAAGTTRKTTAATKKAPASKATTGRGKKKPQSEDEDEDVVMISDDDEDESQGLFVTQDTARDPSQPKRAAARSGRGRGRDAATTSRSGGTQSQLNFGTQATGSARANGRAAATKSTAAKRHEPSDDEISDDDDAFEPPPPAQRSARTGRR
ncbi:hypothetical protein AC579_6301 [Pseudocercospora musae]|uniref:Double-strand break repair protein n=1 Tax=Pseudocercospora musae TaxID=113226 RepID=A0A139IPV0_9PEZI|nr:hypothetical protein AC579_6301 [Pseudocercospora musae]